MSIRPLRQILTFQFILVTILPFTVVALVGMLWLFPQIEAELESRQRDLAAVIGSQISGYLFSAVVPVKVDAVLLRKSGTGLPELQPLLDAQITVSGAIGALYVVSEKGRVEAAELAQGDKARRRELLSLDLSRSDIFRKVARNRRPVWSDSFLSVVGNGLSVAFAVPSGNKAVIGEIRLSRLVEYLREISTKDKLMVLVVDRHGQVIADQDGRYTAQQLNVSNIPLVREEMRSNAPMTGRFTFEGEDMIGSMLHVPDVDWHVLVAQPVRTAYRVVLATSGIAVAGLLMAVSLAAAAAIFMARKMAGRFEALAGQARLVAKGEHSGDWPKSVIREIRDLAEDLQKMSDTLREREEYLEERVTDRTIQLEVAITNLSMARDAAESANRAKSSFLANMSHEIRTPMNAVLGFAQLLEVDSPLSPPARQKVATIMKNGEHLLEIFDDILEMSRIESGRVDVRTEPVDLFDVLDDLAAMFRPRAEEKGLIFTLDRAANLPRFISADPAKLRQILANLLGNAVKFTSAGSIILRAFQAGRDRVVIEVLDSGIGISADDQAIIFRPFVRTRSGEQAAGGTGLGLAISREYARLLGGEITVASNAGEGSCFRLEFNAPLTALPPDSAAASQRIAGHVTAPEEIREKPALEKMPPEWREAFRQALARRNITRLRELGVEAHPLDPLLSAWILERAGRYDLEGLKGLCEGLE